MVFTIDDKMPAYLSSATTGFRVARSQLHVKHQYLNRIDQRHHLCLDTGELVSCECRRNRSSQETRRIDFDHRGSSSLRGDLGDEFCAPAWSQMGMQLFGDIWPRD